MMKSSNSACASAITFGGLALSLLLAAPAAAVPKLPVAVEDQIRLLCEASSADLAGKRAERRCRAEWNEKIARLSAVKEQKVRLVVR